MQDRQIEWNSLVMGDGTPYAVQSLSGIHDSPPVRSGRRQRARAHGSFPGSKYSDYRTVDLVVEVDGDHDLGSDVWDDFSRAHIPTEDFLRELHMQIPGLAGGREVLLFATCERIALPIDQDYMAGTGHGAVQWIADDPLIYDATLTTLTTAVADTSGTGEDWPWEWPIDWGGRSAGGSMTAVNEGEHPTPWVATLIGPLTSPRITNGTTGEELRWDGELAAGETLVINSREKSVLLGGTVSRDTDLRPQSVWFELAPGTTTVRFAASAGSGSIELEFRSAWI